AAALRARGGDHLAEAAAARARAGGHHLAEHALADPADLARPAAVDARHRLGTGTGAATAALVARLRELNLDRDLVAEDGLFERDVDGDLHVLAARRTGRPAAGGPERAATPEERVEDVAE